MTLKQRAVLDVAKIILAGIALGVLITVAAQYLGTALTGTLVALALLIYMSKIAYAIRVSQLESEQDRVQRALKDQ
jgi:hypothetical protein